MKAFNKKMYVIITLLVIIESCTLFFLYKSFLSKDTKIDEVNLNVNLKDKNNMLAIMIEQSDGTYIESVNTTWPTSGYKYNSTLSGCIDHNGNKLNGVLTYNRGTNVATVNAVGTSLCYLYFSVDKSVYQQVKSDVGNGALLLDETSNDDYPVYYYSGAITNNNILYAGFCWKMVRTTDTGGVKLIYNGIPQTTSEGISCNNTGEAATIGKSAYNTKADSLAYVGYMYNTVYDFFGYINSSRAEILSYGGRLGTFYVGDDVTWDGSEYTLVNKDGSEVKTYEFVFGSQNVNYVYTCYSNTKKSCASVTYLTDGGVIQYTNGQNIETDIIKFAKEINYNEDGTYTLVNPIVYKKADYGKTRSEYINYFYCGDLISETCTDMKHLLGAAEKLMYAINVDPFKVGNSFEYANGKYKLVDTIDFWDTSNSTELNNHHYTCFNKTGECEQINYIYGASSEKVFYIILSGGKSVEDAINEMLYADDVNTTNSTIKTYIDTWYKDSILPKQDERGKLYSKYLENTIFCNSRKITNVSENGWNSSGSLNVAMNFGIDGLNCENKLDQFTLKAAMGGTEGYGNNALDYPIGLLTLPEVKLAGHNKYISIGQIEGTGSNWWLFEPANVYSANSGVSIQNTNYIRLWGAYSPSASSSAYVRPSVSLSINVDIAGGDGSFTNPYQLELTSE